jgi:hypothetical protein
VLNLKDTIRSAKGEPKAVIETPVMKSRDPSAKKKEKEVTPNLKEKKRGTLAHTDKLEEMFNHGK